MGTDRARSAIFFGQYAAMLLYALVWVHFEHVRHRVLSLTLFYALIGIALCYVALRAYLVIAKRVSRSWHAAWVAVDLMIITALVRLTGGINSEAALVYFWPIATYSIQRRPRGAVLVGLASGLLYVAATWPADFSVIYLEKLGTRIFVILLVTLLAACYALHEIARVEEIARLREKVGLADYRSRLSQEMHDGIQHYLVGMAMRLDMARKLMDEFARISRLRAAAKEVFKELTRRELEVLELLGKGLKNREIAEQLHISEKTVKNHVSSIFFKLHVNDRTQAALLAARHGLTDPR
jgi:DNA-binding NarL/FixJ family response regulator